MRRSQLQEHWCKRAINQLSEILDPAAGRRKVSAADKKLNIILQNNKALKVTKHTTYRDIEAEAAAAAEVKGKAADCAGGVVSSAPSGAEPGPGVFSGDELNNNRLCPTDGVLEYRLILPGGGISRWVPVIPALPFIHSDKPLSWRRWIFDQCHEGILNAHRTRDQTFHLVKRTGY